MRIAVDGRYLSHGLVGGIHTYLTNLLPALVEEADDHEIFLYVDKKRPAELPALPGRVAVRYLPWTSPLSSIVNDLSMARRMAADRPDVVHFPANYGFGPGGARTIVTLHDAINILPLREICRGHPRRPRTMAMMSYLHWCSSLSLKRASLIITVSNHARREIARYGGIGEDRIVAILHAPAPDLRRIEDAALLAGVRDSYSVLRPFVLADALKNPGVLVEAWSRMPPEVRMDRQIVFFSRNPLPPEPVRRAVAAGWASLLFRPSRQDLVCLYSMAEVFVFPSLIEGFGLPVLEAMCCGAPVLASNRGAIPEVAGDAAILVNAEDAGELSRSLGTLLTSKDERARLRQLGFARTEGWTWQRVARATLACYEAALGGNVLVLDSAGLADTGVR